MTLRLYPAERNLKHSSCAQRSYGVQCSIAGAGAPAMSDAAACCLAAACDGSCQPGE
jgi:hypothetical protein